MEWVETTGKTLAEAKEEALDRLGVDESEAEFEILEEPKVGLFGRLRSEARVRARIQPTTPRAKDDRRSKRTSRSTGSASRTKNAPRPKPQDKKPAPRKPAPKAPAVDLDLEAQAALATQFVKDMATKMGFLVDVDCEKNEEDQALKVSINGSDLGLLIGPRGNTMVALQELTRATIGHKTRTMGARIQVDVAGYRARRAEALSRFAIKVGEEVKASGMARSLEPMNPADRRVVHDAIGELEGVSTESEGEDRLRHVVVRPA